MIKSMTGFSKTEAAENGMKATVELKSLNGRYLEFNTRIPKSISHKELEVREMIKGSIARGTVSINVNLEYEQGQKQFALDEKAVLNCFDSLMNLKKKLKIKEPLTMDHILHFSSLLVPNGADTNADSEWGVAKKAIREALKNLEKMRQKEGQQIVKDIQTRMKKIASITDKIESMGLKRIPAEREKIRQRIAQLFESDEIDENRIQMEIAVQASKLDISEECVRLRSHIKFFYETLKSNEPIGQKLTFLIQEMNREINTTGSKSDDAEISQNVVLVKEELERIREQVQNVE